MSGSLGGGESEQSSSSSSSSRPTTEAELQEYFNSLNQLSGGQLGNWASTGTQQTNYQPLTQGQLQAVGGAGATQKQQITSQMDDQLNQIGADSSLTYAQRQRSNQLVNQEAAAQMGAVDKEVEASMSALSADQAYKQYQSDLANSQLSSQDMALLAEIFYGGMGQYTDSSSTGSGSSWNLNTSGSFL